MSSSQDSKQRSPDHKELEEGLLDDLTKYFKGNRKDRTLEEAMQEALDDLEPEESEDG